MVQDTWAANDRSVDDCPTIDDYPEYNTEAFARAASTATEQVTLEDLTPADASTDSQYSSHDDDAQDENDDNLNDQRGPTESNPSALRTDGTISNTFQGIDALPLEDFQFSNFQHLTWVPKNCLALWGEVFSDIASELLDAVKSSGPTRQRRIGIAARWYLGIPQIFLRDPGRGSIRNAEIIQLRLSNFLEGNYATVLNDWSAAKAKAREKAKPPKADTHAHRIDRCIKLFHQGFLSRGLRILTGNGRADADDPKIIQQMQEKHPTEDWSHAQWPVGEEPDLSTNIEAVVMKTSPLTGVGPRGLGAGPIKQLFAAKLSEKGAEDKQRLTELGQVYFSCEMPTWLRKALNGGLLTPLVKKIAPEGETPDARPTNARDIDVSIWLKTIQRKANHAARKALEPQQLGVAVSGGCEIKVIGDKLKIEEAQREGIQLVLVCLDLKNAHNEYSRAGAQTALDHLGLQNDSLKHLAQAHRADCGHRGDVYMRSSSSPTG